MDVETVNGWLEAEAAPWLRALGLRVDRMACTGAVLTMPVTAEIAPSGTVTTPALGALADMAMQIACAGHFRAWRALDPITLDLQLLQPAKGEEISCTATVLRASKTHIFTRAALTADPSGKEVAAATATFAVP